MDEFSYHAEKETPSAQEPEQGRVFFGEDYEESLSCEWASRMLQWLRKNHEQIFADAMIWAAAGIERPTRGRKPRS